MAKGGSTKGGILKPPENTLIYSSRVFQAFFRCFRAFFMEVVP